jgi:catechol 1,2-dioxygenase
MLGSNTVDADERKVAAATGAAATERFHADKTTVADTPPERVDALVREVTTAVHEIVRRYEVTYAEYDALKAWLIQVGEDGEWPMFLDLILEHVIEEVANESRAGSKNAIEGPFYVPGAPEFGSEATLPMRPDEKGSRLTLRGQVRSVDGTSIGGAVVDIWHGDSEGFYGQFAPGIPEWNLRGRITTDAEGRFSIHTIRPAPYEVPTGGALGAMLRAAARSAWRPAHLHVKVSAPGYELTTTQLYFRGDDHLDDDVVDAVKSELILDLEPTGDGSLVTEYEFVLDRA